MLEAALSKNAQRATLEAVSRARAPERPTNLARQIHARPREKSGGDILADPAAFNTVRRISRFPSCADPLAGERRL